MKRFQAIVGATMIALAAGVTAPAGGAENAVRYVRPRGAYLRSPLGLAPRDDHRDGAGLRATAERQLQARARTGARDLMADRGSPDLGVRAPPGRPLPRRHAVHRRRRGVQHRPCPGRGLWIQLSPGQRRAGRGGRPRHRPHHHEQAQCDAADAAPHHPHHVQGLGDAARGAHRRAVRRRAGDLRLAPCQRSGPFRLVASSPTRATCWSATPTGGARSAGRTTSIASSARPTTTTLRRSGAARRATRSFRGRFPNGSSS